MKAKSGDARDTSKIDDQSQNDQEYDEEDLEQCEPEFNLVSTVSANHDVTNLVLTSPYTLTKLMPTTNVNVITSTIHTELLISVQY